MNDLTFGATLLTCFAILVATVIIEIAFAPARSGVAVSRPDIVTGQPAPTTPKDCATIALAPATAAR
jgi:hypothetical protein